VTFTHPLDTVARVPLVCLWEITRRCNLRCVHCENHGGEPSPRELTDGEILATAEGLRRLGGETIDVTGGEPLLRPGWDGLCARLAARGFKLALITNGTLFTPRAREQARAAGIRAIGLSLDGLQATHDGIRAPGGALRSPFRLAVAGLEQALPHFPTTVITQVNKRNLPELPRLHAFLRDLGVTRWQLQQCVPVGRVRELAEPFVLDPGDLRTLATFIVERNDDGGPPRLETSDNIGYYTRLEPRLRNGGQGGFWTGCQAGIRSLAITYDGRVRGCSALPPEFDAGDVHTEDIEDIWRDAERFAYTTRFDPRRLTGPCARCPVGALCRAGCPTMAYWTTGTIYENPYCLHALARGAPCPSR
jgi:radical SAM protein with 4Fe4S-binding SPASM domain